MVGVPCFRKRGFSRAGYLSSKLIPVQIQRHIGPSVHGFVVVRPHQFVTGHTMQSVKCGCHQCIGPTVQDLITGHEGPGVPDTACTHTSAKDTHTVTRQNKKAFVGSGGHMRLPPDYWAAAATVIPVLALAIVVEFRRAATGPSKQVNHWLYAISLLMWALNLLALAVAEAIAFFGLKGNVSTYGEMIVDITIIGSMAILLLPPACEFIFEAATIGWLGAKVSTLTMRKSLKLRKIKKLEALYRTRLTSAIRQQERLENALIARRDQLTTSEKSSEFKESDIASLEAEIEELRKDNMRTRCELAQLDDDDG